MNQNKRLSEGFSTRTREFLDRLVVEVSRKLLGMGEVLQRGTSGCTQQICRQGLG